MFHSFLAWLISATADKIFSLGNTSPTMADILIEANLSALVAPMFKIAIGLFCCQAAWAKRYDEYTSTEDPTIKTESDSSNRSWIKDTVSLGTESPKKTTWGFKIPPQLRQAGTLKSLTSSSVRNVSPSGAWLPAIASQVGLSSFILCWRSWREVCCLHPMQTTLQNNIIWINKVLFRKVSIPSPQKVFVLNPSPLFRNSSSASFFSLNFWFLRPPTPLEFPVTLHEVGMDIKPLSGTMVFVPFSKTLH